MPQSFTLLWYHLVWSTKNREPLLQKGWRGKLYGRMYEFCREKGYHLNIVNGIDDHVHLLVSLKPVFAISDVVRNIKVDSYYWLQEQGYVGKEFGWQNGYGAFTVSPTNVKRVRKYIERQEEHHLKMGAEDEWNGFVNTVSDDDSP